MEAMYILFSVPFINIKQNKVWIQHQTFAGIKEIRVMQLPEETKYIFFIF